MNFASHAIIKKITKFNLIYLNKNNKIHNQSYIILNNQYDELKKKYKNIKVEVNNQNDLILKLKKDNNKLLENNQYLNNQLLHKERFINLNLYSSNLFSK